MGRVPDAARIREVRPPVAVVVQPVGAGRRLRIGRGIAVGVGAVGGSVAVVVHSVVATPASSPSLVVGFDGAVGIDRIRPPVSVVVHPVGAVIDQRGRLGSIEAVVTLQIVGVGEPVTIVVEAVVAHRAAQAALKRRAEAVGVVLADPAVPVGVIGAQAGLDGFGVVHPVEALGVE